MTEKEFNYTCNKNTINPKIALEDSNVCEILKNRRSVKELDNYLKTNF